MRVRATAIASDRSNAIGVVELECTPGGLLIVHHGVGAFQEGYAPGAVTTGTRVLVPWGSLEEAAIEDQRLFLRIEPALTPHHRLLLTGFSAGDPPDRGERRRQRLLIRVATAAGMLVIGLLVALLAYRGSPEAGAGIAVVLGCLGAGAVLFIGLVKEQKLGLSHLDEGAARLAFATELCAYFPSLASGSEADGPPRLPPLPPLKLPSFQGLLPRTTTAMVITMSASLLAAVLVATWVSREDGQPATARRESVAREGPRGGEGAPVPAPVPALAAAPASSMPLSAVSTTPSPAPPPAARLDTGTLSGACRCARSDSLLWKDGIPRLSTVLIGRHTKEHHGHTHLEVELGVVNNWDQPIPEVSLLVQFYERDPPPSSKLTETYARPVYFEGPLAPGQAIMWHVEARGTEFAVSGAKDTKLSPSGEDAAPTNLIADLLKAVHRPIRLHGAMLLAFLGDPRAKEGALTLRDALREEEAPYIDRLEWALGDVRTCDVRVDGAAQARTVRACLFNASAAPRDKLGLRVRALDRPLRHDTPLEAPPLVLAEHVFRLTGQLAPGQGAQTIVSLDTSNPDGTAPAAFEAYADREDRLF